MRVALDAQHINKIFNLRDVGASIYGASEASIVPLYVHVAHCTLRAAGAEVITGFSGSYVERMQSAIKWKCDCYLACHLNAGGGTYSLCAIKKEAEEQDILLAESILENLTNRLNTKRSKRENGIWRLSSEERGYLCIPFADIPSVLIEPMFIDNADHFDFMLKNNFPEGLVSIGGAIAKGILEWNKEWPH